MKNTLALVLIPLLAFAASAMVPVTSVYATPPPAQGGYGAGWGMNPNNWQTATGTFSAWGLYDPLYGGAGAAWVVGWPSPVYITYAPITLELWIEMYALQSYQYTSYKWHRLGDNAETITFLIQGTLSSNSGQWVSLMKATDPLTHLWFREDIFGRTGAPYGYDLPITWIARWGNGLNYGQNLQWEAYVTPDPDDITIGPIPACDHWFEFQGSFDLAYHVDDGYYSLVTAGCPAPEL